MFARILAFEVKVERKEEFVKVVKDQVLPILRKQIGFLEVLPFLQKNVTETKVLTISLWTTRKDAERYERESYSKTLEILTPFVISPVEVSYSNLETVLCDRFVDALAV
ncbi:MAG: antibiotic biosynthesis monooxygenase [Terriglobales bacterium]